MTSSTDRTDGHSPPPTLDPFDDWIRCAADNQWRMLSTDRGQLLLLDSVPPRVIYDYHGDRQRAMRSLQPLMRSRKFAIELLILSATSLTDDRGYFLKAVFRTSLSQRRWGFVGRATFRQRACQRFNLSPFMDQVLQGVRLHVYQNDVPALLDLVIAPWIFQEDLIEDLREEAGRLCASLQGCEFTHLLPADMGDARAKPTDDDSAFVATMFAFNSVSSFAHYAVGRDQGRISLVDNMLIEALNGYIFPDCVNTLFSLGSSSTAASGPKVEDAHPRSE